MIIVKISGGIGNQLFQYCFAKSLEIKKRVKVKIDNSCYYLKTKTITPRQYQLDKFKISLDLAGQNDFHEVGIPYPLNRHISENIFRSVFRIQEFFRPFNLKKITVEHGLTFNDSIFLKRDNCYISGNWTDPRYFFDISEILQKELSLKDKTSEKTQIFFSGIKNSNSISVHIRRGDYLRYSHKFKILDQRYYNQAVKKIEEKIKNPIYYIFSDDVDYVKNNYQNIFKKAIYISGNNIFDHEELWLMSQCKNNIIANSTFSWWGAWLNNNPEKIVIAPKKYRNDNKDITGLFPKKWIIL